MRYKTFYNLATIVSRDSIFHNIFQNPQVLPVIQLFWRIGNTIKQKSSFPGYVGFLDGSDMVLQHSSSFQRESYFN
ncbi:hypothetical protein C7212DRAFT_230117 [Tuber magnatum]|uniref:Uncharacterized protein n=1 Tax=Tuber magnatum TaxID=42249 RepID=A0A317SCH1_9PEZI|nr:hypothetical protein C7212DRAFT_230117 [Tuber magnatum]